MIEEQKAILRKLYRHRRRQSKDSQPYDFKSLAQYFSTFDIDALFLYAGFDAEPDPLLWDWRCKVALPRVGQQHQMSFFSWTPGETLETNAWGLREPSRDAKRLLPTSQSLFLVPCVAVDRSGVRLGMGGGYYDRYLQDAPRQLVVGLVRPEQVSEELLPSGEHDVLLDGYYDGVQYMTCP